MQWLARLVGGGGGGGGYIYFIPSSEFNTYLKQIKVILSAVKKYQIFFTSEEYDLYFFSVAKRG